MCCPWSAWPIAWMSSPRATHCGRSCIFCHPDRRAAIVLRYYLDLSGAQTAEATGCSVRAVKSQTSAGLGRLCERMGPEVALFTTTDQGMTP